MPDLPPWMIWSIVALALIAGGLILMNMLRARPMPLASDALSADSVNPASWGSKPPPVNNVPPPPDFIPPPVPLAPMPLKPLDKAAERRGGFRRIGNPVLAVLEGETSVGKPMNAWVVDRSRQGLKLASETEISAGTKLKVKAAQSPEIVPWLDVEVRHCKTMEDHFEIGCRFLTEPSWEVLLLFG